MEQAGAVAEAASRAIRGVTFEGVIPGVVAPRAGSSSQAAASLGAGAAFSGSTLSGAGAGSSSAVGSGSAPSSAADAAAVKDVKDLIRKFVAAGGGAGGAAGAGAAIGLPPAPAEAGNLSGKKRGRKQAEAALDEEELPSPDTAASGRGGAGRHSVPTETPAIIRKIRQGTRGQHQH